MKILFLAPYPENESPSQRYRFEHYLPDLRQIGISYSYKPFLGLRSWSIFFKPGNYFKKIEGLLIGFFKRWLLMFSIYKYDFVFIHREAAPMGPPIFEWIIAKVYKKKIIYDFDDAIWIPVWSNYNRIGRYFKWFTKVATICKWSYKISAGNNYLADFASKYNRNVIIIPTVVDTENVHNKIQNQLTDQPVVGWTGTFSTLKYLELILPVLQRLQEKRDFTFVVIADIDPMLPLKNYRFIKWRKETETNDLLCIHIGLMPLYDDEFSKGKCGFKAIQYMSLGLPPLVSPVGVSSMIVDDGINGFLCGNETEWENNLETLLENSSLRKKLGIEAKKKIETDYSVKSNRVKFLGLFS